VIQLATSHAIPIPGADRRELDDTADPVVGEEPSNPTTGVIPLVTSPAVRSSRAAPNAGRLPDRFGRRNAHDPLRSVGLPWSGHSTAAKRSLNSDFVQNHTTISRYRPAVAVLTWVRGNLGHTRHTDSMRFNCRCRADTRRSAERRTLAGRTRYLLAGCVDIALQTRGRRPAALKAPRARQSHTSS
jgi:hypothetical protein